MNKARTSKREQEILNPGPSKNAKSHRIGNQSGLPDMTVPKGRGTPASDHGATEKQNQ
jgi:hypothetical protein